MGRWEATRMLNSVAKIQLKKKDLESRPGFIIVLLE